MYTCLFCIFCDVEDTLIVLGMENWKTNNNNYYNKAKIVRKHANYGRNMLGNDLLSPTDKVCWSFSFSEVIENAERNITTDNLYSFTVTTLLIFHFVVKCVWKYAVEGVYTCQILIILWSIHLYFFSRHISFWINLCIYVVNKFILLYLISFAFPYLLLHYLFD